MDTLWCKGSSFPDKLCVLARPTLRAVNLNDRSPIGFVNVSICGWIQLNKKEHDTNWIYWHPVVYFRKPTLRIWKYYDTPPRPFSFVCLAKRIGWDIKFVVWVSTACAASLCKTNCHKLFICPVFYCFNPTLWTLMDLSVLHARSKKKYAQTIWTVHKLIYYLTSHEEEIYDFHIVRKFYFITKELSKLLFFK